MLSSGPNSIYSSQNWWTNHDPVNCLSFCSPVTTFSIVTSAMTYTAHLSLATVECLRLPVEHSDARSHFPARIFRFPPPIIVSSAVQRTSHIINRRWWLSKRGKSLRHHQLKKVLPPFVPAMALTDLKASYRQNRRNTPVWGLKLHLIHSRLDVSSLSLERLVS
jgi:hypothetical protein